MFVDVSVIEIFLNYERVITSRIYPSPNSKKLELFSLNGNIGADIKLWDLVRYK